jgi:hypothetical protein
MVFLIVDRKRSMGVLIHMVIKSRAADANLARPPAIPAIGKQSAKTHRLHSHHHKDVGLFSPVNPAIGSRQSDSAPARFSADPWRH